MESQIFGWMKMALIFKILFFSSSMLHKDNQYTEKAKRILISERKLIMRNLSWEISMLEWEQGSE